MKLMNWKSCMDALKSSTTRYEFCKKLPGMILFVILITLGLHGLASAIFPPHWPECAYKCNGALYCTRGECPLGEGDG